MEYHYQNQEASKKQYCYELFQQETKEQQILQVQQQIKPSPIGDGFGLTCLRLCLRYYVKKTKQQLDQTRE